MAYILESEHKNKPYLKYFEDIAAIPHGTYNEQEISNYIVEFAKKRGLYYVQDDAYNVFIKKPATPGYENHETIILQGHMDMVCEKVPDSKHDFLTDPLKLYIEDGWLTAEETTLGADDGVAVAYILAILDDENLEHPALECVINTGEEAGVLGAKAFDTSILTGKKFIGLDGCTEGTSTIMTSGVIGGTFFRVVDWEDNTKNMYKIKIFGLSAGHAAANIGNEQSNAIKAIGRILYYINKIYDIRIAAINGGSYRNAIAEECEVIFSVDGDHIDEVKKIYEKYSILEMQEHKTSDPDMKFSFEKSENIYKVLTKDAGNDLINFMYFMPSGTCMRSVKYDFLPIASRNIGTVKIVDKDGFNALEITYIFRCVNSTQLEELYNKGCAMAGALNFSFELQSRYSGYEIKPGSDFYNIYAKVYKEMSGKDLTFETVHYGTDVGTYAERISGLDIIVLSPEIQDVHRPTERLNLASFDRAYGYLKEVIRRS